MAEQEKGQQQPVDAPPPAAEQLPIPESDDAKFAHAWLGLFGRTTKDTEDLEKSAALFAKACDVLKAQGLDGVGTLDQVRHVMRSNGLPIAAPKEKRLKKLIQTLEFGSEAHSKLRLADALNGVLVEHQRAAKRASKQPVIKEIVQREPTPTQVWREHKKETKRLQTMEHYKGLDKPVQVPAETIIQHVTSAPPSNTDPTETESSEESASTDTPARPTTPEVEAVERGTPAPSAASFEDYYQRVLQQKRVQEEDNARRNKAVPSKKREPPQTAAPAPVAAVAPAPVQYIPIYMPPPPEYMSYTRHKHLRGSRATRRRKYTYSSSDGSCTEDSSDDEPPMRKRRPKRAERVAKVAPTSAHDYEPEEEDTVEVAPTPSPQEQDSSPRQNYMMSMASQFLGNGRVY